MTCFFVWYGSNIYYSHDCHHSDSLFACVGLKHKQYCILNKQYSKEEYESLVGKIIEHMQQTGEWGEYFSPTIAAFGYNETIAQEHFPLSKTEVLKRGWKWHEEEEEGKNYMGPVVDLPETIAEIDETICDQILLCEKTKKPYKINLQEFKFYQKMGLPIPKISDRQRHLARVAKKNPFLLWDRKCKCCGKKIQTSYAEDRKEMVYCEECYLETVY